jgi:hypothetical protein
MNEITKSLATCFATGFAVQQAVEIVSSCLSLRKEWDSNIQRKKAVLSLTAFGLSLLFVCSLKLDVIQPLRGDSALPTGWPLYMQGLVTVVFISAGTEGFNSLLKWLSYKKEDAKATAADKKIKAGADVKPDASPHEVLKVLPS